MRFPPPRSGSRPAAAFSLTELLIAVGLLSLIVFALYSIFDQTQKALRASLQQSEMNEAARPAMDLMVREIQRAEALGVSNRINFLTRYTRVPSPPLDLRPGANFVPVFHSGFFFGEESSHRYRGLGFFVGHETNAAMDLGGAYVGTLYKYEDTELVTNRTSRAAQRIFEATQRFLDSANGGVHKLRGQNSSRLVEGVVHFRLVPSDSEGLAYDRQTYPTNRLAGTLNRIRLEGENGLSYTTFLEDRVPPYVEIELGVIDSKTLDQYRSIPDPAQALNFLSRNAGKVQLFRQRVSLRTALR